MSDTEEQRVASGYDLLYAAIPHSPTFQRLWREHALGPDYPAGFEHISFLTLEEMRAMAAALQLSASSLLVDLACGMGGPGLWIARDAAARLIGIDISAIALEHARSRADRLGMSALARFTQGSFAHTGLDPGSVDAAMSSDALQYAPDKRGALTEVARILRPGGRFVFACFEFDPDRVAGLPVLGTDPLADYEDLLSATGFDVKSYAETQDWHLRLTNTYQSIADARDALKEELGEPAANALLGEVTATLQLQPYRRRVLVSSVKR